MAPNNKDIAELIVDYLSTLVEKKEVSNDSADSLNVAIDCISEAFEFEKDSVKGTVFKVFNNKSLASFLDGSNKAESVKVNVDDEDSEAKSKAETLKLEGNKLMASKDFQGAIEKYTQAIDTYSSNPVYYANRAAAYSSLKQYEEATEDAKSAIKVDPTYSKGYSRLGFAKFAQGQAEEALEAYKKVLDIEGDKATDVMKRDYETAKKKVEQSLNIEKVEKPTEEIPAAAGAGAGGMPDLASMLGGMGGAGGMGGLAGLLNNPQVMQAAQQMMSNPQAMSQMQEMMKNPSMRQMAEQFQSGNGGAPDLSAMMNDPAIQDMAKNMFGNGFPGAPK